MLVELHVKLFIIILVIYRPSSLSPTESEDYVLLFVLLSAGLLRKLWTDFLMKFSTR